MCFAFKKNNKQTKKPVNCFLQDDANAGIQSLQTSIEIKLCQNPWNGLQTYNICVGKVSADWFHNTSFISSRLANFLFSANISS